MERLSKGKKFRLILKSGIYGLVSFWCVIAALELALDYFIGNRNFTATLAFFIASSVIFVADSLVSWASIKLHEKETEDNDYKVGGSE